MKLSIYATSLSHTLSACLGKIYETQYVTTHKVIAICRKKIKFCQKICNKQIIAYGKIILNLICGQIADS